MSKFSLAALVAKFKSGNDKPAATAEELENLAELKADLDATKAAFEVVNTAHAALEADLETSTAALTAARADLTAQNTAHTQALAALEASVSTRAATLADAKALDLLAGQSVPAPKLPHADKGDPKVKTLKRAEFEALEDDDKASHFRAGGKIVD